MEGHRRLLIGARRIGLVPASSHWSLLALGRLCASAATCWLAGLELFPLGPLTLRLAPLLLLRPLFRLLAIPNLLLRLTSLSPLFSRLVALLLLLRLLLNDLLDLLQRRHSG